MSEITGVPKVDKAASCLGANPLRATAKKALPPVMIDPLACEIQLLYRVSKLSDLKTN